MREKTGRLTTALGAAIVAASLLGQTTRTGLAQTAAGEAPPSVMPVATAATSADGQAVPVDLGSKSAAEEAIVPKQDLCLHCHVEGEKRNPLTPPARWVLFGAMGLLAAYGTFRSATVWQRRRPWVPVQTRAMDWLDSRYTLREPLGEALSKPVHSWAQRWWYCLGGMTFFAFLTQAVTGIMLAFYYKPTPEAALASIEYIQNEVRFGAAVRTIHQWAANGMIVLCVAHMLRVFIMGAYKPPRELMWVSGATLLVITMAFGFTGYLLPWDQRAFWATTVGSDIAGGIPEVGPMALLFLRVGWEVTGLTLSRFYAMHMLVLPVVTLALLGAHFLMIRRQSVARPL